MSPLLRIIPLESFLVSGIQIITWLELLGGNKDSAAKVYLRWKDTYLLCSPGVIMKTATHTYTSMCIVILRLFKIQVVDWASQWVHLGQVKQNLCFPRQAGGVSGFQAASYEMKLLSVPSWKWARWTQALFQNLEVIKCRGGIVAGRAVGFSYCFSP